MIAHSKIKNLDDAIASCTNYVETYGVLSELNIDIIEQGEKIVVKYKGVVDINNAFIKIYGSTNNNSLSFASTINTLKSLEAEIITMSNNGEVVDTKYNHHASVVYLKGKLVSMDAIKVEYINSAPHTLLHKRNSMFVVGLVEDFNIELRLCNNVCGALFIYSTLIASIEINLPLRYTTDACLLYFVSTTSPLLDMVIISASKDFRVFIVVANDKELLFVLP